MRTFATEQVYPGSGRGDAAIRGPSAPEHPVIRLQRTIGNQAVLRMLQRAPSHPLSPVGGPFADKDHYDLPDTPEINLPAGPTLSQENVVLDDQDSRQCEPMPYSALRNLPDYVDNGIVSVGAELDDFWTAHIKSLKFQYADAHFETIDLKDIDLSGGARTDRFVRRKGVIYPLRKDGRVAYDEQNTPTIVSGAELKTAQRERIVRKELVLAKTVFQFQMALASLAAAVAPGGGGERPPTGLRIRGGGGVPSGEPVSVPEGADSLPGEPAPAELDPGSEAVGSEAVGSETAKVPQAAPEAAGPPEVAALRQGGKLIQKMAPAGKKGAEIIEKSGGAGQATREYESVRGAETVKGDVRYKTLSDGTTVTLRGSTAGPPTVSIQHAGGGVTKIRYR
jgi:hypothetical protein